MMKGRGWKFAVAAVLLLGVGGVLWLGRASSVEVTSVEERELVESLVVTGTASPVERSELNAEVPGRVVRAAVASGGAEF